MPILVDVTFAPAPCSPGRAPQRSHAHLAHVALEFSKLVALLAGGVLLPKGMKEKPLETTSLTELAAERMSAAKRSRAGRATSTVHGGSESALRQVLLAFTAGHALAEHESPGEATLQVLRGSVRVTTATGSHEAAQGDHLVLPFERHGLTAISDAVVLLTVVLPGRP